MKLKEIIFGIAIIILTISVVVYGISTIYPSPKWDDFCGMRTTEQIETPERCEQSGGYWQSYENSPNPKISGYCDRNYYCGQDYERAMEDRSLVVFISALIAGIAILIVGSFLFKIESVGAGLMGGGVGSILYGVGNYWRYTDDWLRFLISLVGLAVLIWFIYRLNKKVE